MPEFGPNSGTCMLAMAFSKEDHVVVVGLDESQAVTTRAARSDVCTEKYADIKKTLLQHVSHSTAILSTYTCTNSREKSDKE